jgi:hypothetical protein
VLGAGVKQGYIFEVDYSKAKGGLAWMATARPTGKGTGGRFFMTNSDSVIYFRLNKPYVMNDDCAAPSDDQSQPIGK